LLEKCVARASIRPVWKFTGALVEEKGTANTLLLAAQFLSMRESSEEMPNDSRFL